MDRCAHVYYCLTLLLYQMKNSTLRASRLLRKHASTTRQLLTVHPGGYAACLGAVK